MNTFSTILLILSIVSILIFWIKIMNVNYKMKQILYKQGENCNPKELELNSKIYGIHNFVEAIQDAKKRREFKKRVSLKLYRKGIIYQIGLVISLFTLMLALNLLNNKI